MSYPDVPTSFPPQGQSVQPGLEYTMNPRPIFDNLAWKGSGKLKNRVCIVTGGDSGIGRSACCAYAKEGAKVVIAYLDEDTDAFETRDYIKEHYSDDVVLFPGDLRDQKESEKLVDFTMNEFGAINVLVNNHAVQYPQPDIFSITNEQLHDTFAVNVFSYFYLTRATLKHMGEWSSIINTTSIVAYRGSKSLLDYSATKGALTSFTRSLALQLADCNIRVNSLAPGPIWSPLIVASYGAVDEHSVSNFGGNTPMSRAGQPFECAPAFVYLASDDSRYVTGSCQHINGGDFICV